MIHFLPVKEARVMMSKELRDGLDRIYNWQDTTPRTWCILETWGPRNVIGVVQFELHGELIHEMGTVVVERWRDSGTAGWLWTCLLENTGAVAVKSTLVSEGGDRLAESLRRRFPEIDWQLSVKRGDL